MFTFWYSGKFNALRKNFQEQIKKESRLSPSLAYSRVPTKLAQNFIDAIDLLMYLNYQTDDANHVITLLEEAESYYTTQNYSPVEALEVAFNKMQSDTHIRKQQLNLHFAQHVLCCIITLSLACKTTYPILFSCLFILSIKGLHTDYLIRTTDIDQHIDSFIQSMKNINDIEKRLDYQYHPKQI